jgi:hypothetical protein
MPGTMPQVRVGGIVRMISRTVSRHHTLETATYILTLSHLLQVRRIYAVPHPTQMVHLKSWDEVNDTLKHKAVSQCCTV